MPHTPKCGDDHRPTQLGKKVKDDDESQTRVLYAHFQSDRFDLVRLESRNSRAPIANQQCKRVM